MQMHVFDLESFLGTHMSDTLNKVIIYSINVSFFFHSACRFKVLLW